MNKAQYFLVVASMALFIHTPCYAARPKRLQEDAVEHLTLNNYQVNIASAHINTPLSNKRSIVTLSAAQLVKKQQSPYATISSLLCIESIKNTMRTHLAL